MAPSGKEAGPFVREIPAAARSGMRVPARVVADERLWEQIDRDRSVEQLMNVATLPGVQTAVYAMPDVHEGYGFPVGAVAAMRVEDGVISPGGVGYDINCGVRLLASTIDGGDARPHMKAIVDDVARRVPAGKGSGGGHALSDLEIERVLVEGSRFFVDRGMATADDLVMTEAGGCLEDADASKVSERARQRGRDQLGTLGSGNHFIELQIVEHVFDPAAAKVFGLEQGQVTVLIHTGSRGLGHQVCTDYVRRMDGVMAKYGISVPDRDLACAPIESQQGKDYFAAMCASANFAWANRQAISHAVREVFRRLLGKNADLRLVYDVAHNIAKAESHAGDRLLVHRKGATRAFGPSHPETPDRYRSVGQPVLIPGSMGTASYVLAGTDAAGAFSFASACHGAGRAMSRGAARRAAKGPDVRRELEQRGIVVRCTSPDELAEEAPFAYKDVDRVVDVVVGAGIARKVARLLPLGVVKG
jgi:tRNA-splicing ligase RtcB (3'-phosphate/5'-hydroxy nucleic acid ligase)